MRFFQESDPRGTRRSSAHGSRVVLQDRTGEHFLLLLSQEKTGKVKGAGPGQPSLPVYGYCLICKVTSPRNTRSRDFARVSVRVNFQSMSVSKIFLKLLLTFQ